MLSGTTKIVFNYLKKGNFAFVPGDVIDTMFTFA